MTYAAYWRRDSEALHYEDVQTEVRRIGELGDGPTYIRMTVKAGGNLTGDVYVLPLPMTREQAEKLRDDLAACINAMKEEA